MNTATAPSADIRGSDLALAVMLAVAVLVGSGIALAHAQLEHASELPGIDPGLGIPIAVRPVADSLGGLGQTDPDAHASVPIAWRRKADPRVEPDRTKPITRAPKKPHHKPSNPVVPDEPVPVEPDPNKPTPEPTPEEPNTEPETQDSVEPENTEPESAEPENTEPESAEPENAEPENTEPESTEPEGAEPESTAGEQEGGEQVEGETAGDGTGTDPLLERAIAFYRARLVAWFSARFRVTGSGLSAAQLAKYRVRVHIDLGEDLRIVDYHILSSDHSVFEEAARNTLEKLRGQKLPPPPENYPGAVQRQLTVTFTCAEDTCD